MGNTMKKTHFIDSFHKGYTLCHQQNVNMTDDIERVNCRDCKLSHDWVMQGCVQHKPEKTIKRRPKSVTAFRNCTLKRSNLTVYDKAVFIAILSYRNTSKVITCLVSQPDITKRSSVTSKTTIKNVRIKLQNLGILVFNKIGNQYAYVFPDL